MVKLFKSMLYFSTSRLASRVQWTKPHELAAALTYIRFLHNPLLRTVLAAVSQDAGLWFVACRTDLKDNLSVTDGEQRQSLNLPLIFWSNWFLSECDRSQSPDPCWFTGSRSYYLQYWFLTNVLFCSPLASPLVQGYNPLSTASKRVNIFIFRAHVHIQTAEIKAQHLR